MSRTENASRGRDSQEVATPTQANGLGVSRTEGATRTGLRLHTNHSDRNESHQEGESRLRLAQSCDSAAKLVREEISRRGSESRGATYRDCDSPRRTCYINTQNHHPESRLLGNSTHSQLHHYIG